MYVYLIVLLSNVVYSHIQKKQVRFIAESLTVPKKHRFAEGHVPTYKKLKCKLLGWKIKIKIAGKPLSKCAFVLLQNAYSKTYSTIIPAPQRRIPLEKMETVPQKTRIIELLGSCFLNYP